MNIQFREATLVDAKAISELSHLLGYTSTVPETTERLKTIIGNKTNCAFVAVAAGEVIGWIHGFCAIRITSESFVEIGGLVVDEKARGVGVGSKLIQKLVEWGVQQSILYIRVRTNTARPDTHSFYQKLGFTETKEQKVFVLKL